MNLEQIRTRSISIATSAGIGIPEALPLLADEISARPAADALNRLLVLNIVAAVSYGFDRANAVAWLKQERLDGLLTQSESRFVASGLGTPQSFQVQIEAMWVLAWALSMIPQLDFWKDCDGSFAAMLPNLKNNQSSAEWRRNAKVRPTTELVAAADLAYCLHWAVRQAQVEGKAPPARLKPYVIEERRRALEWLLSNERWDAVPLDT